MKILYVIDNLEFGGGERGFLQIIKELSQGNYSVKVACHPGGKFEAKLREMNIPLEQVNMENRFNILTIFKLVRMLKEGNFHIVHSQGARADFFARVAVKVTRRSHLVSTIQMPVEGYDVSYLRKKMYRIFDRLSEKQVDRFIVVSDSLKRILIEDHRIPSDKVFKIFNGVELDMYRPDLSYNDKISNEIRKTLWINNDIFVIGSIGRMVWQKGFEYLIRSFPKIIDTHPKTKILLIGDGPLKKRLEELAKSLNVTDRVIFTGFRSDIKEILSAIDLLIVPSLLEGFPMIILEAMAMAKPIIATNIDGIIEQITDGKNGILVPPKDPGAIEKAIDRVLSDKNKTKKMGLEARKKAEQKFSVERMVKETEKVYSTLSADLV